MSKPAFLIEEGIDSLTVTLKPRKQWFAIVLTVLIFFAFLFTFIPDLMSSFVRERQASSSIGVTVAILVYTFLSIALLTWSIDLIWQFKGWEVVQITRESFNLHHQIGNLRISRKFSLKNLERIKVLDMKSVLLKIGGFERLDFMSRTFIEKPRANKSPGHEIQALEAAYLQQHGFPISPFFLWAAGDSLQSTFFRRTRCPPLRIGIEGYGS